MLSSRESWLTAFSFKVFADGPFEGGSLLELTGLEDGALDVAEVEVFDASQRYLRKF